MNYYKIKSNKKDVIIRSCYDEETIRNIFMNGKRKWDEYKKREEGITGYKVRDFSVDDVTGTYNNIDIINVIDTDIVI